MPWARASNRGAALKARFAVKGIQKASRSLGRGVVISSMASPLRTFPASRIRARRASILLRRTIHGGWHVGRPLVSGATKIFLVVHARLDCGGPGRACRERGGAAAGRAGSGGD